MPTLTAYENRVLAYRGANYPQIGKRAAKTIARMLCERQARMLDTDLERIFSHSDPTPREAIKNIEREKTASAGTLTA